MSQPQKLYRLQQLDSQLDQARNRLQTIASILSDQTLLHQTQAQADLAQNELNSARKALRTAEDAVQAQRIKIEQTDAALYGGRVRIPKELQDLQLEVASLKRYLAVLEDHQLEAMLAVEEREAAQAAAQAALVQVQGTLSEQHASLKGEQTNLNQNVASLENERHASASALDPADLQFYEQLRQQRRGVAVALIKSKTCGACGSVLNTAVIQTAASPTQVARCPNCGRILYAG